MWRSFADSLHKIKNKICTFWLQFDFKMTETWECCDFHWTISNCKQSKHFFQSFCHEITKVLNPRSITSKTSPWLCRLRYVVWLHTFWFEYFHLTPFLHKTHFYDLTREIPLYVLNAFLFFNFLSCSWIWKGVGSERKAKDCKQFKYSSYVEFYLTFSYFPRKWKVNFSLNI